MGNQICSNAMNIFEMALKYEEEGNFPEAISLYKRACRLRFSPAYINLGNIYDDCDPKDERKAIYCYRSAIKLGDETGAYCMAIHYKNKKMRNRYLFWLKRAADLGYEDAINQLKSIERASVVGGS